MKKIVSIISTIIMLSCVCFAKDYSGYIVKIKEDSSAYLGSVLSDISDGVLFGELDSEELVSIVSDEFDDVDEVSRKLGYVKAVDEEALSKLQELGIVESYEKDILMELFGYDYSDNPDYDDLFYLDYINAQSAWDIGITGKGVKVGVIDSGVSHNADIVPNLLEGKNYAPDEDPADTSDKAKHGTGVAGVIAAACNDISTVGVAFDAKIVPLKVTYFTGSGHSVSTSCAVRAIEDAVNVYGCDVINMSFGTSTRSQYLEEAVNYAINNGVIVVAATGNYGNKTFNGGPVINPPLYPAYFDGVVGVANAAKFGTSLRISDSSTYHDKVTIAAPGTGITMLSNANSGTYSDSGTSFSSPMVAAAAALAKSVKPDIGQAEFKNIIMSTADSSYISSSGQSSDKWGAGLLDIDNMLRELICDVSAPKVEDGEVCVYINNLSSSLSYENCAYTISEYDEAGKLLRFKVATFSIGPSASHKISLSSLGFSEKAVIEINYEYCPGDVDGDGRVDVRDASTILRHFAGYHPPMVDKASDVNGDGVINVLDASVILRYLAGYAVKLN